MEKRRCLLRNFLWHKWTEILMITKLPNTISTGKIMTVVFSSTGKIMTVVFSYSFLAITYESHTQFYTPPLVYSGITMYKEYETKQTPCALSTCTSPTNNLYVSPNHYWNSETHFGRWSRLDVYSTHRWNNEKIDTHFTRDGGIAPVDVLFNTGAVIRW